MNLPRNTTVDLDAPKAKMGIKSQNYNFKNQISISNYDAYTEYNLEKLHNWTLVAEPEYDISTLFVIQ